MAINDGFLNSITDALINRVSEPGKLDDVSLQVREIVQGLQKSARVFDKFAGQMSAIFKAAGQQVNRGGPASKDFAREMTSSWNKIMQPLHDEIKSLVRANSQVNRTFEREFSEQKRLQRDTVASIAKLQARLESRAGRTIAAVSRPVDNTSFQAQLTAAFAGITRLQQSRDKQLLGLVREEAFQLRSELRAKLGESPRYGWPRSQVTGYQQYSPEPRQQGFGALRPSSPGELGRSLPRNYGYYSTPGLRGLEGPEDIFTRTAIRSIEGGITARPRRPAHSTDYGIKKGAGQSPEGTPAWIGAAAINIDRQIGVINQFLRNIPASVSAGVASELLKLYENTRAHQEKLQQGMGRGSRVKADVRGGEMLTIAAMAGFNTRIDAGPGHRSSDPMMDPEIKRMVAARNEQVVRMLSSSWAKPTRAFTSAEISTFANKYQKTPSVEVIGTAAQMAAHVGTGDPRFGALANIILSSQAIGRQLASTKRIEQQKTTTAAISGQLQLTEPKFKNFLADESGMLGNRRGGILLDFLTGKKSSGTDPLLQARLQKLEERRQRSAMAAMRRASDVQSGFESTSSSLGMRALDAEVQYQAASDKKEAMQRKLRRSKAYPRQLTDADIEARTAGPTRAAEMRSIRAEYAFRASQIEDPDELRSLRREIASRLGVAAHGVGPNAESYTQRAYSMLSGRTTAQKTAEQMRRISQDQAAKDSEFARRRQELEEGRALGGRGSGGGAFGGSRSGYGFGLGLAGLAAYDHGLKELVKDMSVYAARTQQMEFATQQMARVSGLNVDEVEGEVEAIKKLNVTTQVAQQTVQRFMMMQIDLAKATKLVSVAQDLAAISGQDAMETVSRLSQAVLTGYTRNLHMMGLQVTAVGVMRDLKRERKAEGKTGTPSTAEQRQALVNTIISEGSKVAGTYERSMSTAGGMYSYLSKEAQETANVLGKQFLPVFSQVMLEMTGGLQFVQKNAEAFASLTKVLVSLGVAASALGSMAFLKYLGGMALGELGLPGLVAGGAIAAGSYLYLNRDKSGVSKGVAAKQFSMIDQRVSELQKQRADLLASKNDSPEWQAAYNNNTASLASFARNRYAVQASLTQTLAGQFNEKVAGWSQGSLAASAQSFNPAAIQKEKERQMMMLAESMGNRDVLGIDIRAEADRQRSSAAMAGNLPAEIVNKIRQRASLFTSSLQDADVALEPYLKRLDESTGSLALKAKKSFGTPREKAILDYQDLVDKIDTPLRDIREAKRLSDLGRPEDVQQYLENLRAAGGAPGSTGAEGAAAETEGRRRVTEREANVAYAKDLAKEDLDIELSKINALTKVQIQQIQEQAQVEQILSGVVKGRYDSEEVGANAVLELKKKNLDIAKETIGIDQFNIESARIQAEADQARNSRAAEARQGILNIYRMTQGRGAELGAQAAMSGPGGAESQLRAAFKSRIDVVQGDAFLGDADKIMQTIDLLNELDDALIQLGYDRKQLDAESRISRYADMQELISSVAGVTAPVGRTQGQISADDIARTQLLRRADVSKQLSELSGLPLAPGSKIPLDQRNAELTEKAATATAKVNLDAAGQMVDLAKQQRGVGLDRLAEEYRRAVADKQKLAEVNAVSSADEQSAARTAYEQKLAYIQIEFDKRKAANQAIDDIERNAAQERHDAEMEYLDTLVKEKQGQLAAIESVAGSLFDVFARRTRDKQHAAKDLAIGLGRQVGTRVLQNVAIAALGGSSGALGTVIPGQEKAVKDPVTGQTTYKKTLLGKILAGTPFGVTHNAQMEELQRKLQIEAQARMVVAEDANTKALQDLTEAIKNAQGLIPGNTASTPSSISFPGSSGAAAVKIPLDAIHPMSGGYLDTVNQAVYGQLANVISGGGGGSSSSSGTIFQGFPGAGGAGSGTSGGKSGSKTSKFGSALLVGAGTYQAITGFKKGGASGVLSGIGGTLTAAAGIAAMIPGLQVAAPFLAAGAMVADLVGSMLTTGPEQRQRDINNFMSQSKYLAPTQISAVLSSRGNLISSNMLGTARDSGIASFPIPVTQTQYGTTPSKTWADPNVPEYYQIPGQVATPYSSLPGGYIAPSLASSQQQLANSTIYNITLPISAMDSKDVIARSSDIAAALQKEMNLGNGVSRSMQTSIFGAGGGAF